MVCRCSQSFFYRWLPRDLYHDNRRKLERKIYFRNDPFLFKFCVDGVIHRYVLEGEMARILSRFHDGAARGHNSKNYIITKVMEAGFYWPTLYKDAWAYVAACDKCQRASNICKRDNMLLNSILVCEFFLCLGH